jgi:Protein of unknown function (DUF1524)
MLRTTAGAVAVTVILATACTPRTHTGHPPPVTPGSSDAGRALAALTVRPEDTGAHYRRADWGDWSTHPGSCSTRAIVLQRHATSVTTGPGCRITSGRWVSPYDQAVLTDPARLDIDHRVPLAEAARSGTRDWDRAQRARFANDLDNLVAVSATANRSKGDSDPGRWRPSNRDTWCGYAAGYIATKTRYQLTIDPREHDGLTTMLTACPR